MMLRPEQITLRPVVASDDALILSVYASTRASELQQVPWTNEQKDAFVRMQFAAQKQHYAAMYPAASYDVIQEDETAIGRLWVERKAGELHILDITVLPEHRGRGAGGTLLRRLLEEAGASANVVTIYVESFSPSLRLFEQLGFRKEREEGYQFLMKWQAQRD